MYRSILVPLDESVLAEQALPVALELARRSGATVRLARVHVPVMLIALGETTIGGVPTLI